MSSTEVTVRVLGASETEAALWEAFVSRNPRAASDHLWGWRGVLSTVFNFKPFYLLALREGTPSGVLPLFSIPRGFRRSALSSVPFGNYGGIAADDAAAETVLLEAARALTDETRAAYLELRHRDPIRGAGLTHPARHARFSTGVDGVDAALWEIRETVSRGMILAAERDGMTVESSRDTGALYRIHVQAAHRSGNPCFPRAYFDAIARAFPERVRIYYVLRRGNPIAFRLALRFKSALVVQSRGALESATETHSEHLLHRHMIREAACLGLSEVDDGRCRIGTETADLKLRLGTRAEVLGYQYHMPAGTRIEEPAQVRGDSRRRRLLTRAWRRLPVALARTVGPAWVRYVA